jgi:hypothetical protein
LADSDDRNNGEPPNTRSDWVDHRWTALVLGLLAVTLIIAVYFLREQTITSLPSEAEHSVSNAPGP